MDAVGGFKRLLAERAIREIKTRTVLYLTMENKPLTHWKDVHDLVLNSINFNRKTYRSRQEFLNHFFTTPSPVLPYGDRFFKYKIGQKVRVDLPPGDRRQLNFKYSLRPGKKFPPPTPQDG